MRYSASTTRRNYAKSTTLSTKSTFIAALTPSFPSLAPWGTSAHSGRNFLPPRLVRLLLIGSVLLAPSSLRALWSVSSNRPTQRTRSCIASSVFLEGLRRGSSPRIYRYTQFSPSARSATCSCPRCFSSSPLLQISHVRWEVCFPGSIAELPSVLGRSSRTGFTFSLIDFNQASIITKLFLAYHVSGATMG